MLQQTQLDTMKELLETAKLLIPLLTEKKIDNAIAGIAEAKKVIAEKNEVISKANDADKKAADADKKLEAATQLAADNAALRDSLSAINGDLAAREKAIQKAELSNAELSAKLSKQLDVLAKKKAELDEALAAAKAEKELAEALKKEFNDKLKLVKAL